MLPPDSSFSRIWLAQRCEPEGNASGSVLTSALCGRRSRPAEADRGTPYPTADKRRRNSRSQTAEAKMTGSTTPTYSAGSSIHVDAA